MIEARDGKYAELDLSGIDTLGRVCWTSTHVSPCALPSSRVQELAVAALDRMEVTRKWMTDFVLAKISRLAVPELDEQVLYLRLLIPVDEHFSDGVDVKRLASDLDVGGHKIILENVKSADAGAVEGIKK